jgi:hypothetical protein
MRHLLFTTEITQTPTNGSSIRSELLEHEREMKLPVALGFGPCGQRGFGKVHLRWIDGMLLGRTAFGIEDEKEE